MEVIAAIFLLVTVTSVWATAPPIVQQFDDQSGEEDIYKSEPLSTMTNVDEPEYNIPEKYTPENDEDVISVLNETSDVNPQTRRGLFDSSRSRYEVLHKLPLRDGRPKLQDKHSSTTNGEHSAPSHDEHSPPSQDEHSDKNPPNKETTKPNVPHTKPQDNKNRVSALAYYPSLPNPASKTMGILANGVSPTGGHHTGMNPLPLAPLKGLQNGEKSSMAVHSAGRPHYPGGYNGGFLSAERPPLGSHYSGGYNGGFLSAGRPPLGSQNAGGYQGGFLSPGRPSLGSYYSGLYNGGFLSPGRPSLGSYYSGGYNGGFLSAEAPQKRTQSGRRSLMTSTQEDEAPSSRMFDLEEPSAEMPSIGPPPPGMPSVGQPSMGDNGNGQSSSGTQNFGPIPLGIPSIQQPPMVMPSIQQPSMVMPSVQPVPMVMPSVQPLPMGMPSIQPPLMGMPSIQQPLMGMPSNQPPLMGMPSNQPPLMGIPNIGQQSAGGAALYPDNTKLGCPAMQVVTISRAC